VRLIVGLGNPGPEYRLSRHNIGFVAADAIARRYRFPPFRAKFRSELAEGDIAGSRLWLMKPQTYMNDSGDAVGAMARFYKIAPEEILVIHDEIDLAPGKIRVKRDGGAAGHNGIRSIDAAIGADYWRLRIGVGHPGSKEAVVRYLVNQNFTPEDLLWAGPLVDAIVDALPILLGGDAPGFTTKVALILRPRPPRAERTEEQD
jgi:peptidyl-tRNA hydrolase, PTH1 family